MASIKFSKTMDVKAIDAGIKSLANRGKKFQEDVQQIGLAILAHTDRTGDYTKACALYHALPNGAKRASLVAWFLAFGKVVALDPKNAEEKAKIASGAVFKFASSKATDMEGAEAKQWCDMHKEAAPHEVFDVQKSAYALLARIKKATQQGSTLKVEGYTPDVQAALAALELALNTKHAALVTVYD